MVCTDTCRQQQTRTQKRDQWKRPYFTGLQRCHAAGLSVDPQVRVPLHHCTTARPLQPPQAITPPRHTPLLANRLAKVSNERARLEIEAIAAKVVKDLRGYHNPRFHLLHLATRRLCKRSRLLALLQVSFLS